MSHDTISTRTEALNSVVRRYDVSRGFFWSSEQGVHCAGTESSLTEKWIPIIGQACECLYKWVRQPVLAWGCLPQVVLFLCWTMAEGNGTNQLLCPQRGVSMNVASQGSNIRRVNKFPTMCPQRFSDKCFHTLCLCSIPAFSPGAAEYPLGFIPSKPADL